MFGHRFFGARYYGARYFGPSDDGTPAVDVVNTVTVTVTFQVKKTVGVYF